MATKKAPAKPTGKSAKTVIPARGKATKSAKKKPATRKSTAKPLEEKAIQTVKKMGRPTKFTPEVTSKILAAIRGGNYIETAAAWAGVDKVTIYDWLKQGAAQDTGKFRDFSNAVAEALAHAEIADVNYVGEAAKKGDWRAAAWRLERRNPKKWGRQETPQSVTIETDKGNGTTKVTLNDLYKQFNDDSPKDI